MSRRIDPRGVLWASVCLMAFGFGVLVEHPDMGIVFAAGGLVAVFVFGDQP